MEAVIRNYDDIIENLPCLNQVLVELLELDPDDFNYYSQIIHIAEKDPTFTARLIEYANRGGRSSFMPISTISNALPRIGLKKIQGIIATYALADTFKCSTQDDIDLWIHSVMVAVIARTLAPFCKEFDLSSEEAYTAGLLHDIGRFIFLVNCQHAPLLSDEKSWIDNDDLVKLEIEKVGIDHTTLGGYACAKWNIPEFITTVVWGHHVYHYQTHNQYENKIAAMVRLIQLSDSLSMLLMHEQNILALTEEELHEILKEKCIHPTNWEKPPVKIKQIIKNLEEIVEDTKHVLMGLDDVEESLKTQYSDLFFRVKPDCNAG